MAISDFAPRLKHYYLSASRTLFSKLVIFGDRCWIILSFHFWVASTRRKMKQENRRFRMLPEAVSRL